MTNEVKNVPELRFPGFEDEWKEKKLGTIFTVTMGQSPNSTNYTDNPNDTILVQGNADIYKGKIWPRIYTKEITKLLERNDIILSVRAPVGEIGIAQVEACIGRGVCSIKGNKFLYYFLDLFKKQNRWSRFSQGSTFESISGKDIRDLKFYVCNSEEQNKIGEFFNKLDRQIELEEQKLAKLEKQKKGYMQKIFSQELRFQDENGADYPNWKKKTIKEVANLTAGKSKKNENKGKYIIMDMGTVTKNGTMLTHKSTRYESDLLNKGDLVMPKDDIGGGHIIGKTVFIPESHKYVLGDHVYRLEIKKCNSLFLHFFINSDIVNHSLKRKVTGSAQLGLNRKSVEEEVIKTPCLEEQGKIGNLFNKIDNLIELQIDKIELLKQRKQGLLQKMFV